MNTFDPTSKQVTSSSLGDENFVIADEWKPELVDPKHPALHTRAFLDPFASDVDWNEREQQMIQLMHDNMGMGLAAPQTGSHHNMFVMTHSVLGDIGVYNPEIIKMSENCVLIDEGCLTFPLLYLKISRPETIRVRYTKTDGETIVETDMDGMDARCFQHEYQHLQGQLYLDLVGEVKLKLAKQRRDKLFRKLEKLRK